MRKAISILLIFTGLYLVSCEETDKELNRNTGNIFTLGDTVLLHVGDTAFYKNDNFLIVFNKITEDSRCPLTAMCVWEGNAKANFSYHSLTDTVTFDLNTAQMYENTKILGENIVIMESVLPYPSKFGAIEPADYSVRLIIKEISNYYETGTVKDYTNLDGCGYIIELDNGIKLEPMKMSKNFLFKDNQRVKVSYKVLNDMTSVCMVGKIVEIIDIKEI